MSEKKQWEMPQMMTYGTMAKLTNDTAKGSGLKDGIVLCGLGELGNASN